MRWRAASAFCIACLGVLAARPAHAGPEHEPRARSETSAEPSEATLQARRHFKLGIRLYQDTNYSGALAEFEAAYAAKPGPGSLQNVALCQRALFRYREAAETLAQLLARHDGELSDGEKKAVRNALTELHGLVGSIIINVDPSDAKVTIDGRMLAPSELHAGVEVNVGEHSLVAEAPGYARLLRVVSVASGQKHLPVEMKLKTSEGVLSVVASDPLAAIAVDGVTRAFHEWRGGVKPDTDHLVQVFRDGYESYESTVSVGLGKTLEIEARLGARLGGKSPDVAPDRAGVMPPPPARHLPRGYYGLLTLGVLGLSQHPLELSSTRANAL